MLFSSIPYLTNLHGVRFFLQQFYGASVVETVGSIEKKYIPLNLIISMHHTIVVGVHMSREVKRKKAVC
jgi:hypothetical protein